MPTKKQLSSGEAQSLPNMATIQTILDEFGSLTNDWPGFDRMKVGIVGLFRILAFMVHHDYSLESSEIHAWEDMIERELGIVHGQLKDLQTRLQDAVGDAWKYDVPTKVVKLNS